MGKHKVMSERTTILKSDVGSRGFGLNGPTSDHDLMGVCIEDLDTFVTLDSKFEQYTEKALATDDYSGHDLTIYSLEKFARLALHGNPTILALLFAKNTLVKDDRGVALQALKPALISRHWGKRFLGYMESQRQKLVGEKGQKRVNRPELEEKYGFDTKYAMHLLRLGMQGVEVMETGNMTIPFAGANQEYLMAVRIGKIPLNECLQRAGELERELKDLLDSSPLPESPNKEYVDTWVRSIYWDAWKAREKDSLLLTREDGLF